jgi:hypothetical protein
MMGTQAAPERLFYDFCLRRGGEFHNAVHRRVSFSTHYTPVRQAQRRSIGLAPAVVLLRSFTCFGLSCGAFLPDVRRL